MSITLRKIELRNFLSFEHASLTFSSGFYLIKGFNYNSQDSNGSGKTNLLSAIVYGLYGRTLGGLTGSNVSRWNQSNQSDQSNQLNQLDTEVSIEFQNDNDLFFITRTPSSLLFKHNGTELKALRRKDIQSSINDIFGTYEQFINFNVFTQYSTFILQMTDSQKKELFKLLLDLSKIDIWYERVKDYLDMLESKILEVDGNLEYKKGQLDYIKSKSLPEAESGVSKFEEEKKMKLDGLENEYIALKKEEVSMSNGINGTNGNNGINEINNEISRLQSHLHLLSEKIKEAQVILARKTEFLKEGEGEYRCEVCGSSLSSSRVEELVEHLKAEIQSMNEEFSNTQALYNEAREKLKKNMEILNKLDLIRRRCSSIEEEIKRIKESKNNFSEILKRLHSDMDSLRREIKELERQLSLYRKDKEIGLYLKRVLSKEGVISWIIENVFHELELILNRFLSNVSRGFSVRILPQTRLADSSYKEAIDVKVLYGNRPLLIRELSGGEQQKINISFLLALYLFSRMIKRNNINFLIMDEAIDLSLAEKGQNEVLEILRGLVPDKIGQIFLTTHKNNLGTYFDYEINVVRENDISRISP